VTTDTGHRFPSKVDRWMRAAVLLPIGVTLRWRSAPPPYLTVLTRDGFVILNAPDPAETRRLHDNLLRVWQNQ